MEKLICPKCKEIVVEAVDCEAVGIITCDNCNYQISWECDGKEIISK